MQKILICLIILILPLVSVGADWKKPVYIVKSTDDDTGASYEQEVRNEALMIIIALRLPVYPGQSLLHRTVPLPRA